MTAIAFPGRIQLVDITLIDVMVSRERDAKVFKEVAENIQSVGLKKPISVTERAQPDGSIRYHLICGEGRLDAFRGHGALQIPCLVMDVSDEDAYIMSLVENIARRRNSPLELLSGIDRLRKQGFEVKDIAGKTGLAKRYVYSIVSLLHKGEERLITAVERGHMPMNVAIQIAQAGDDDKSAQAALQKAYEEGTIRGGALRVVKRVLELRRSLGPAEKRPIGQPRKVSASFIVKAYKKEVQRQTLMIRKADLTQQRILFAVAALKKLLLDEHFVALLRAEGLSTMPKPLADRVSLSEVLQ